MVRTIKEKVTVEREGAIEIRHPDLKAGSQAEVIILIDKASRPEEPGQQRTAGAPIWEVAAEIARTVPDGESGRLPSDLSKNLDHYLYGAGSPCSTLTTSSTNRRGACRNHSRRFVS